MLSTLSIKLSHLTTAPIFRYAGILFFVCCNSDRLPRVPANITFADVSVRCLLALYLRGLATQ